MASLLLSIDVGTSGVRAALFDEAGREAPSAQVRTRRSAAGPDFGELDPDQLVAEVIRAIDELLANHAASPIEFIAISAFWHSMMGVDSGGLPATSLLTWADTRAARFANDLRAEFNESEIHARTGCRFHPSYWPAKLRWLRLEQPERFQRTRRWLGFAEYLCLRLFDEPAMSISMASATGIFNQRACNWDGDFVAAIGVSAETLPELKSQTNARLAEQFVLRWPALAEARLVTVVGDGAANNIGAGCSTRDKLALMVGTSGAMRVLFAGEPPAQLASGLWSYRACQQRVVVGGALSDGGGLVQWLNDVLNFDGDREALQKEIATLEPDAHGLTVLPFWSGERSTGWLAEARGGIFGLQQQTRPAEIARAVLEAIAYRFALIARGLDSVAPDAVITASGNALRSSPVWLQITADVLGRPLMLGGTAEASSRGAALLALEAVGKIGTIEEDLFAVTQVFEPDLTRHARYQEGLERQEKLYERLYDSK